MYTCVPVLDISVISEASNIADAVELRLDHIKNFDLATDLATMIRKSDKPVILTYRPSEQGGAVKLSLDDRRKFWTSLDSQIIESIAYADFELDLVESFDGNSPIPWHKVICSWHNFDETPDNLREIFDRMSRTPAGTIKIATRANTISDCLKLYELTRKATKPFIVLGMGAPGLLTRVLANSWGGLLTFGAIKKGEESASGQPTIDDLKNLYRANSITRDTNIFGLIGNPVSQSLSPLLHNRVLKSLAMDGVYIPFQVDNVEDFMRDFVKPATRRIDWNLGGLSVTIPHKLSVIPCLDHIDETARIIGAINTIVVKGGELLGFNTDVAGAIKPLINMMDIRYAKVAVIGAGGAARAVCYGLKMQGVDVIVHARNSKQAANVAHEFKAKSASIDEFTGDADIVINCTPVGMLGMNGYGEGGGNQSPLKPESLRNVKLVYDLIYNPERTQLIKDAETAGCKTLGGLSMLKAQAEAQFKLWTDIDVTF